VPERLAQALADRYRLDRELGAGGMATVYLARDLKHDRDVALKVLRPELAAVLGGERFLREIRVTAKLNHPHILPLLDSGGTGARGHGGTDEAGAGAAPDLTADGRRLTAEFLYYVMPYVEGESLRERLTREPQLPLEEALALTWQIASALDCAHEQGIVHRDIKPENILLSKGEAVVADFGIALAVRAAGGERLTETGLSLGTPQYMSPEQATGSRAVDARSDVYSLGAVLYEMLVGEPPHTGATVEVVLAKLMTAEPVEPRAVRRAVPEHVNKAVLRALAKQPVDRYATAGEFAAALTADGGRLTAEKSIVVLPFENLSPDPDNAFFADGLTEELIADLSKVRALRVISRTSAMMLKGVKKDLPSIAREVNVRYVLEGSVRRAGSSLRITAQLIEAATDAHLWAEKYSGTVDDVFEIQERVSRAIVDALMLKLSPQEQRSMRERPIEDLRAYECYLRAKSEFWSWTEEGLTRGLRELQRGLEIIGPNERLYAAEGSIYLRQAFLAVEKSEYVEKMEDCANRIFGLNLDSPHGHFLSGLIQYQRRNIQQAVRHLKRTLAAEPQNPDALFWLVYFYGTAGKTAPAEELVHKLIAVDPLVPLNHMMPGWLAELRGRLDVALKLKREFYDKDPDNPWAGFIYAWELAANGQIDETFEIVDAIVAHAPENRYAWQGLLLKYALLGDKTKATELVTPEREKCARDEAASFMADCYALLGEPDLAVDWLEIAVNCGYLNYPWLNEYDPFLSTVRGENRFKRLMERVKREWEAFEV